MSIDIRFGSTNFGWKVLPDAEQSFIRFTCMHACTYVLHVCTYVCDTCIWYMCDTCFYICAICFYICAICFYICAMFLHMCYMFLHMCYMYEYLNACMYEKCIHMYIHIVLHVCTYMHVCYLIQTSLNNHVLPTVFQTKRRDTPMHTKTVKHIRIFRALQTFLASFFYLHLVLRIWKCRHIRFYCR
jgi:hypothetical protein